MRQVKLFSPQCVNRVEPRGFGARGKTQNIPTAADTVKAMPMALGGRMAGQSPMAEKTHRPGDAEQNADEAPDHGERHRLR